MINEAEISSGQKSGLDRNIPEDQIMENKEVKAILDQRLSQLEDVCQQVSLFPRIFLETSMNLPKIFFSKTFSHIHKFSRNFKGFKVSKL